MNYYNEFHPQTAQWLRELIAAGEIPNGIVDDRSIVEVTPGDLALAYLLNHLVLNQKRSLFLMLYRFCLSFLKTNCI